MSAAGGLSLPQVTGAGSPKEGSGTPTSPQFPSMAGRLPSLGEQLASAGNTAAPGYLPPQLVAMADPRLLYSALVSRNL